MNAYDHPDRKISVFLTTSLNVPMSHILPYRWATAFKNGEVMVGNWFEHMREVMLQNALPKIIFLDIA